MTTPIFYGSEFLVNTTTADAQFDSNISALADGRFLVTWSDNSATGGDAAPQAIFAQIFNADGSKSGLEFRVNTITVGTQIDSSVSALADGGFVVSWMDNSGSPDDVSGTAIRAQLYFSDGSTNGLEFLINTTTSINQSQSAITTLADGRFVVSWTDQSGTGGDPSGQAVRAQIFNADGSKSGLEFLVNTTTTSGQSESSITALTDGRFVVSWKDFSATGNDIINSAIRAQVFNADGSKSGLEFLVNTTTALSQTESSITALADGRFVVSWTDASSTGGDTSSQAVRAQVFNSDGSKSGLEFLVNTTTPSFQIASSITALADGRFVVSWTDGSQSGGDPTFEAIRAQVFNGDGSKSGTEFLVTTTTAGAQSASSITALADGRFVVSWTDGSATGGDPTGNAIRAQIFDPRTNAITLVGTTFNDDFVGTYLADTLSGSFGNDKIAGGIGNDLINGNDGNDVLRGDAGGDTMFGGSGNDSLDGGIGGDIMNGGTGNDSFVINGIDVVQEASGGGTDQVLSAVQSLTLAAYANVENATLTGALALNLIGTAGSNSLIGNSAVNTIIGNAGNDTISGKLGNDVLAGGAGNDIFIFDTLASPTNRDTITDFTVVDTIKLENAIFTALGGTGTLSAAKFFVGSAAHDATDRIIYKQTTGALFYDADGNGAGAAIQFATLTTKPIITNADFMVV